jgi:hypothetical protein
MGLSQADKQVFNQLREISSAVLVGERNVAEVFVLLCWVITPPALWPSSRSLQIIMNSSSPRLSGRSGFPEEQARGSCE